MAEEIRAKAGKYLTFLLGDETYGIEILKVQEIIGMMKVTHFPKAPEYIRGVINLRGSVIPVLDLRVKFSMDKKEDTEKTCVVVVNIEVDGNMTKRGIIVDEVSEVIDIETEMLEEAPDFGQIKSSGYVLGVGKVGEKVIILIDVVNILGEEDFRFLEEEEGKR